MQVCSCVVPIFLVFTILHFPFSFSLLLHRLIVLLTNDLYAQIVLMDKIRINGSSLNEFKFQNGKLKIIHDGYVL
jgi:hypothetical protein